MAAAYVSPQPSFFYKDPAITPEIFIETKKAEAIAQQIEYFNQGSSAPLKLAGAQEISPQQTIQKLLSVDLLTAGVPVPQKRTPTKLVDFFNTMDPQTPVNFDDHCSEKTGIKLEGFDLQANPLDNSLRARAQFSGANGGLFIMDFNPKTKSCNVVETYRGQLPVWMKIGDSKLWTDEKKGIPTAKVVSGLLMKALGMNQNNVEEFQVCSMNAQTAIDVIHSVLVDHTSDAEAFASSHSAILTNELAELIGFKGVILNAVKSDCNGAWSTVDAGLDSSYLSKREQAAFRAQPKIADIKRETGVDLNAPNSPILDAVNLTFKTYL